jgi:hypothetical protein
MDLDVLLPFVLPIAAACAARPLSERLPPRTVGLASISVLLLVSAIVAAPDGAADLEQVIDHVGVQSPGARRPAPIPGFTGHLAMSAPSSPGPPPSGDAVR